MKALIAAVFRVVALLAVAQVITIAPNTIVSFSFLQRGTEGANMLSPMWMLASLVFELGFAAIVWLMAPAWAEKTVSQLSLSDGLVVPDLDWMRLGAAIVGICLVGTGVANLIADTTRMVYFTPNYVPDSAFSAMAREQLNSAYATMVQHALTATVGVFLYFGKQKLMYFWNRSGG